MCMDEKKIIDSFTGDYAFLSNYYPCSIDINGIHYTSSEAAFQSFKTTDPELRKLFAKCNPAEAKKLGRQIELRPDWEDIKVLIMMSVCVAKFVQNSDLSTKLIQTEDAILIEGNTWHDNYWGDCRCPRCKDIQGINALGTILMLVRYSIINLAANNGNLKDINQLYDEYKKFLFDK